MEGMGEKKSEKRIIELSNRGLRTERMEKGELERQVKLCEVHYCTSKGGLQFAASYSFLPTRC